MRFDTKIAVVVRDDLAIWQKLNVTAFLVSGIAAGDPECVGEPYIDATDHCYRPMFRQPVMVFAADADGIRAAFGRAVERGARLSIFTRDLFATGHDEANRVAVRAVPRDALDLAGFALRDDRRLVDRVVKGLVLHG